MRPDGICEANVGLYLGGAVSVGASLAGSWGCPEPATVTLRAGCVPSAYTEWVGVRLLEHLAGERAA